MKSKICSSWKAAALAVAALAGGAFAQVDVRPGIAFDPYAIWGDPLSNLTTALCSPPGTTLRFAPGLYRETATITTRQTLTGTGTGSAVIGSLGAQRTTLKVLSWNTHLFGVFPLPVWQDEARADAIGDYLNAQRTGGLLDFAALQEVWAGPEAASVYVNSGMLFMARGDQNEGSSLLNSGLMFLSTTPLANFSQSFFSDERGQDGDASKGWIQTTIVKDGFSIGIFDTHTQSGDGADDATVRDSQLWQMSQAIWLYRVNNPTHAVIIMGDFNIRAGGPEHPTLRNKMGFNTTTGEFSQFGDVAANLGPCGGDFLDCTSCPDNALETYFYGAGSGSGRIDFIFYNHSRDGTVRVVPKTYEKRRPQAANSISGAGWAPDNCLSCSLTTRTLSDHDAIFAEFELHRN
ncbi:MAG: endonuclease/exonuclease/phosphatase family protein [Phycisphaerales bacterium]